MEIMHIWALLSLNPNFRRVYALRDLNMERDELAKAARIHGSVKVIRTNTVTSTYYFDKLFSFTFYIAYPISTFALSIMVLVSVVFWYAFSHFALSIVVLHSLVQLSSTHWYCFGFILSMVRLLDLVFTATGTGTCFWI